MPPFSNRPGPLLAAFLACLLCSSTVQAQINLALRAAVDPSGPTWGGLQPAALTDGDPSTFVHPLDSSGTLGFYFEIDLGRVFKIERILLRNRADGCCPERLSNYHVELYADDEGEIGPLTWSATVRADGSNSGTSGVDTITAAHNPNATFAGRFLRIVNANDAPYSPQIAEVEVYGGTPPSIHSFTARPDAIRRGESTVLSWQLSGATTVTLLPNGLDVSTTIGAITVAPSTTTVYTLSAVNDAGTTTASVKVGVDVQLGPPEITEFMADNQNALKDEDGDNSDWIELRNTNEFSLSLNGFFLTDDPQRLNKWSFPAEVIPPQGYVVVFASGKNRSSLRQMHTNFRLGAGGDYLALVDANLRRAQEFNFPAQSKDSSYGLGTNQQVGFFRAPTPDAPNGAAYSGLVADTTFSHDRGFYETNFSVSMFSATPGAVIRYSLNRSDPTATSGSIYTGPIPITGNTVLRAAAFREGWAPTDIDTHTYLFVSNVIASSVMRTNITRHPTYSGQIKAGLLDVPSVSIVTPRTINGSSEVKSSFEWLPFGSTSGKQDDCGVRNFGGAFTTFAKKNFRLYFRAEYGASKLRHPIFDGSIAPDDRWPVEDEFDQLELRSGSHDMVERGFYMSNIFTDDTMLEMGQLNPHGRFVHLYLNGTYWGLYHLRERWGAAMHESYLGGARTNYESINGNWNVGGWAEPGTAYDGDGSTWARVKELRGNYGEIKSLLDIPQYVDFMITWLFGGCEDEYRCVGPNVAGSGFKFYVNDADGWFCGPWYCAAGNRTGRGAPGRSDGDGPGSIFSMLFREARPDYRVLLADRISHALLDQGALTPARNAARLLARTREIERAFLLESARWNYLSPAEWANRRNHALNNWFPSRTAQVLADFRAAGFYPTIDSPNLNPSAGIITAGTELTFVPPSRGTIYFTLDGSDPRLPGGQISPTAKSYSSGRTGEVTLPAGSTWRWFTDATGLGSSDIVVGHASWSASNWKHPAFNDRSWSSGPAQLGFGEGDESTVVPFGPDSNRKWTTVYFRRSFVLAESGNLTSAELQLKRDDGAVVYINGREALRSAMPNGTVTSSTLAESISDDGQSFHTFSIPISFFAPGTNTIAVELHQTSLTSTDSSFDLELQVTRSSGESPSNSLPRVTASTLVKARVKDGSTWSALREAFYQVGPDPVAPGELAIAELNYDNSRAGNEFLELSNLSQRSINLRGAAFTDGINYAFPKNADVPLAPGQRLLLVRDLFRFQQAYGREIPVAGIYSGRLSADGETLQLESGSSVLATVSYHAVDPWPSTTGNFSLAFAYPQLNPNNPHAWRLGLGFGSPGTTDSTAFFGQPGADVDQDGFPALLEYALGTNDHDPASGHDSVEATLNSQGQLTFAFQRRLGTDDVLLQCESSTDLIGWDPAIFISTSLVGGDIARETWTVLPDGSRARFMRLSVYKIP